MITFLSYNFHSFFVSIFAYIPFLNSRNQFKINRLKLTSYRRKIPIAQTQFQSTRMQADKGNTPAPAPQKAAAAFRGHTPAPPADNRNDSRPGIPQHHTGTAGTPLPPGLPASRPPGRFPRINPPLGKLPGLFLSGTFANQQLSVLPDHQPCHIGTIQSFHAFLPSTTFPAFPAMFFHKFATGM